MSECCLSLGWSWYECIVINEEINAMWMCVWFDDRFTYDRVIIEPAASNWCNYILVHLNEREKLRERACECNEALQIYDQVHLLHWVFKSIKLFWSTLKLLGNSSSKYCHFLSIFCDIRSHFSCIIMVLLIIYITCFNVQRSKIVAFVLIFRLKRSWYWKNNV